MKANEFLRGVWEAIRTYFIPLGLLGTGMKMYSTLPVWGLALIGTGMVAYIAWNIYTQRQARVRERKALAMYESLLRVNEPRNVAHETAFKVMTVHRSVTVDRPDAVMTAEESLVCVSDIPQNKICRTVVADSRADFADLAFWSDFDCTGQWEKSVITPTERDDGRSYGVEIGLRGRVVHKDERIKLRYGYRWPAATSRNEDYWVFPVSFYSNGVGSMIVEGMFPAAPVNCTLSSVDTGAPRPVSLRGPDVVTDESGRTLYKYSAEIGDPRGNYILAWKLK